MEQYNFSNSNIDRACETIGKFMASAGVERREALRNKLTFEAVLLEYQDKFGEDSSFKVRCLKRLSAIKIEIIVGGESFDPFDKNDETDDVIRSMLSGSGLAPTWSYKRGNNYIAFTPKKKAMSGTVKMVVAIGLSIACGLILSYLPEGISTGINDMVLTPVTDAILGLISAVAGPLIFLSVLGSICSMGNMETLGKIGSKTIKIIVLYITVIAVCMTALGSLFYHVEWGSSTASGFSQVLDLIYAIIPTNLFEPFLTGNALQLIFIAIMVGLAMLVLAMRVSSVFSLVEQCNSIVQTVMTGLSSMLPALIFVLFTGMISSGNFRDILGSWKMLVVILLLMFVYSVINLLRVAITKKISPVLLFKKTWPTRMIALTTASSAAAFSTNIRDANKKLGIDKKLVEFGVPIGQVLFKPGYIAVLFGMEATFAEMCDIQITLPWLIIGLITNILVSSASPPVPGGLITGFTVAFTQLGIPLEVLGIAIAVSTLTEFPATSCIVSNWQINLIDVADSLNMLDKEKLHKEEKNQ